MPVDPLDLERLAVRIERLVQTSTHGWAPGDELEFQRGLGPNSRRGGARTMEYRPYELPSVDFLRQTARNIRAGVEEGYSADSLPSIYRNALQVCLRLEGLVRDNDPRNPKRVMRDMARGKFPGRYAGMAARVATSHMAGNISLRGEAQFPGTGKDKGWLLYFTDVRPSGKGYSVEGYLRGHMYDPDDQWVVFTATLEPSSDKLKNFRRGNTSSRGFPVTEYDAQNIIDRLFSDPVRQEKFWKFMDEMFPASVRGEYQGKLPVVPLSGKVREWVSGEVLSRFGGHAPYGGGRFGPTISATPPVATPAAAEDAAKIVAKKYEADQWPGGMAAVVGLVKWVDHGTWSGLVNSYYSPS